MNTAATPLSPYHFRQMADSLRAFSPASAHRQIDMHLTQGDITERDAQGLRRLVDDTRLWLY